MIKQSIEILIEQSNTMTSLKSAGRTSSTVLRNGHMKIGYHLWQKEEELIKNQYCLNPNSSNQFLSLLAIQGHSGERKCYLILRCKTMYCYRKDLPSTSSTSETRVKYIPAACIERAVCMKTTYELYQKVCLTPRVPRVVLKANLQCGQQDPQNQEARSSWEPSSDSKSYGETCCSIVDYRISGVFPFCSRAPGYNT